MREDDRARVAMILFLLDPRDYARVAMPLRGLADDIRIEQPLHSLRRRASAEQRAGMSSGLTGQAFGTSSQFSPGESRRKTSASSSGSKRASKLSPGKAGAKRAGTVRRRLESSVTVMVGLSTPPCWRQRPAGPGPIRALSHTAHDAHARLRERFLKPHAPVISAPAV